MTSSSSSFSRAYLLLLALPLIAYIPGLSGSFLLDDYANFVRLEFIDGTFQGYLLGVFGSDGSMLDRPVSFLTFLLNVNDWPNDPGGFKAVNLFLHLVVTFVVFALSSKIPHLENRSRQQLAFVLALTWSLSALHVSTVLYAVQRMTILATLFSLLSLFFYLKWRLSRDIKLIRWELFASAACVMLSFLSKENGIISVLLIAILELYVGGASTLKARPNWLKYSLAFSSATVVLLFLYKSYITYSGYESRVFTFEQRLLLQGQVIFDYIRLTFVPNVSYMTLFHDGYELDIENKARAGVYFWLAHLVIIGISFGLRSRCKFLLFGVGWFYISHLIESSFIPLELMFEHRNYLPSIGLFFIFSHIILLVWLKFFSAHNAAIKAAVLIAALALLIVPLMHRTKIWGNYVALSSKWAFYKVDSARAQYDYIFQLENLGELHESFERSVDSSHRFAQLGFKLHAWRLGCKLAKPGTAPFPSTQEILSTAHSSEVDYQLALLLALWREGKCVPVGYTNSDVDQFVESILQMTLLDKKPRNKAKMLEHISSFYLDIGRVDKASKYLLMLYETQPTVETALRNIEFALAFGMLEYAEEYIVKAESLNRMRGVKSSHRRNIIDEFRRALSAKKQLNNDKSGVDFGR